ncbi:MAG: GAF domain-containing protein [Planctomycetota bacterium]
MPRDYTDVIERCGRVDQARTPEQRAQDVSDILWEALGDQGVSWAGFYFAREDQPEDERLVLVACRDKPACSPIGLQGVCGQGYVSGRTRIVADVRTLGESYIACDPRDLSEIVIPLFESDGSGERCVGVLDLDSFEVGSFDNFDDAQLRVALEAAGFRVSRAGARS